LKPHSLPLVRTNAYPIPSTWQKSVNEIHNL
jgi:hypothetical protein